MGSVDRKSDHFTNQDTLGSDDRFKYFFYNNLDLACFASLDGYFEELNESFTKVLGYATKDLKGRKFLELIHPDDVRATLEAMENLSLQIGSPTIINRYRTKSGTYRHIEWNSAFDPATQKIYAIGRDITNRLIASNELAKEHKDKEDRAAELLIANAELIFQNKEKENRAAELTLANKELAFQNEEREKRAAELVVANIELSFQNQEKENRAAELVIANKELAFQNEEKEKRAAELIVANAELLFQNQEKERRAAELIVANAELLFQNQEKENRAAELVIANKELAFQNVEKEKRADELSLANGSLVKAESEIFKLNASLEQRVIERTAQLEFANNELESFSYSVSHDLRAPLRAISGNAKILEEDFTENLSSEGMEVLHAIMRNSRKMGELIDDLLAFSKLGRKQILTSDMDMGTLVKLILDDLSEPGKTEFKVDKLPRAKGDPSLIRQVWFNLISNAIKYSKYKAVANIEIGSYEEDNVIVYYVKDHGAGFDMQYYDKLFGVFQRLHSHEEFEGTGIGLAIVQKIVGRHQGKVWAESKIDEGACFYFSLPIINS